MAETLKKLLMWLAWAQMLCEWRLGLRVGWLGLEGFEAGGGVECRVLGFWTRCGSLRCVVPLTRRYVSGRVRPTGEINGKSGNLNNCLKHVIFAGATQQAEAAAAAAATGGGATTGRVKSSSTTQKAAAAAAAATAAIPVQEVVVVFDADMVCKPNFFRHVSSPGVVRGTCQLWQASSL
jgi:hypothetical protein